MKRVVLLAALLSFSAWGQSEGNASKRLQRLEEQMAEQADPLTETEANALYQAKDVDLSLWAGLTPAAFFQTLVDDADAAAVRSTIGALASASYTAADVLSKLLTVDGSSSGVDADLLDGSSSAAFLAAASYTAADVLSKLLTVDGSSSLLDADLLDGSSSAAFAASSHTHAQGDVTNLVSDLAAKLASSSYTASDVSTKLQTVDGSGSGIDADLLDGISSAALAALASPTFTGNPLGPTASANDSDTSLATTAFVQQEIDDADNLSDNCAVEADSTPVPYTCVGTGADPYTNTLGSDGDKGDVVVGGTGTTLTLDSGVVTAAAKTVLDDASIAAMRTTLLVPTDLVWVDTPNDVAVNNAADVTIETRDVTGVVAGDQLIIDAWFTILNNSTATRVYVITLDCDGLFDIEFTTGALATSATLMHPFHVQAVCDIRATNLAYEFAQIEGQLAAGIASGGDVTMAATNLEGQSWGTSTSDATGTTTVALKIRSANATATQTLRLHSLTIRKVTPG